MVLTMMDSIKDNPIQSIKSDFMFVYHIQVEEQRDGAVPLL